MSVLVFMESADDELSRQALTLAQSLGDVRAVTVDGGRARCEQEVPGGRDVYDVGLPAVVTVKEGLNLPRYPSVPAKLRAKSKPLDARPVERPVSKLEKLRLVVPAGSRKQAEILGEGPGAAPRVVEVMQQLGVA